MLRLKKVAVTGGLSCGKSSVCRIFKELGAQVVSADEIVHQLLSPNEPHGQQVIKLIGSDIVVNQQIDRSKIAKKVFNNSELLHALEKILHPAVKDEIEKQYQQTCFEGRAHLFIAEIPLLFESNLLGQYDVTIAVIADQEKCRKRFNQAKMFDEHEFDKRMARQLPAEQKARQADIVIHNDGSLAELRQEVVAIYKKLLQ